MPTLQEQYEAYKATRQQSEAFSTQKAYEQWQQERAQGGAIRTAPPEPFPPVGAVVGGVAGSIAGGPLGGVVGTAFGEAAQQGVETALGLPQAPQSLGQSAQRITQEAMLGAAGEAVGRGGQFLVSKFLGPFAGTGVSQEGQEALKLMGKKAGETPMYLPAELNRNHFLNILQNISEFSILGGKAIETFKQDRDKFFNQFADEIINTYGARASPVEAGRMVADATKRNLEVSTFPAKMIYEAIEADAAPDYASVPVKMTVKRMETPVTEEAMKGMKVKRVEGAAEEEAAEEGLESEIALKGLKVKTSWQDIQVGERLERMKVMLTTAERQIGGPRVNLGAINEDLAGALKVAKEAGGLEEKAMGTTLLKFLADKPDIVSYPVAKAIRTEVRVLKQGLQQSIETKNAPAIAKASQIYSRLTDEIRKGLNDYDPFLAEMWDTANVIEREGHEQFNNALIRKLVKQGNEQGGGKPEAIANSVWSHNNTTGIQRVRAAVDPADWQKMQSVGMQDIIAKSLDTKTGIIQATKLEQQLFGPNGLGEEAIKAGYDSATVKELKDFISAVKVAQKPTKEGTGRVMIQLQQGGVITTVAGALLGSENFGPELMGTGGVILLGPGALAKVMTHPSGIKWLTEGFKMPAKSAQAAGLMGRILQAAFPRPDLVSQPPDTAERRVIPPGTMTPRGMELEQ